MTITTRAGKGSPLTHDEVDADFTTLESGETAEAATEVADVATLTAAISAEASTRASADSTLAASVTSEASARATADGLLLAKSDNLASVATPATAWTNLGGGSAGKLASDTDGTLAADSDTRIATQKATKTYVDAAVIAGGGGNVVGPSSATDGHAVLYDGTTGKLIKDGPALSGTNTGDQTSVTGNAGTATALQTSRTIDGQGFDGSAAITVIAPGTHGATGKTTPVDADELPLVDSAASNVLKKLTWANLKATVKAYFDTLYPSGSGTSTGTNTGDQTSVSGNAGTVTTNANLTGPITSTGNATAVGSQTGTGSKFVMDTAPTLVTPTLGAASATSINKVAITAPATSATLAIANSKTLTVSNTLTLAGTDSTTMTFPSTSATIARTDAGQTFTGGNTFSSAVTFSALTAGRIPFSGTAGLQTDSANLAWDNSNTRLNIGSPTSTSNRDIYLQKTVNGDLAIVAENLSSGTAGQSYFVALNSSGNGAYFGKHSTGYTTNGLLVADQGFTYNSSGNMAYYNVAATPHIFVSGGTAAANEIVRFDPTTGVTIKSGVKLQLGNAYVAGAQVMTGVVTLYDNTGTAYDVLCKLH